MTTKVIIINAGPKAIRVSRVVARGELSEVQGAPKTVYAGDEPAAVEMVWDGRAILIEEIPGG